MQDLRLDILQKKESEDIKSLIGQWDFNDYKYYRVFRKEILDKYIFEQILEILDKKGLIIVAKKGNMVEGLISLVRLNWGKDIFGIEMAEFKHIISNGTYEYKKEIIASLLSYILQLCNKDGIQFLSCRVDTADFPTIHCLEKMGFELMETQVTYLFNKEKHKVPEIKDLYSVRNYRKEDLEILVDIVRGAFTKSRFYVDPYIPNEKVDEFYIRWIKGCAEGLLSDKILVAERGNDIVGFLSYRVNQELAKLSGFKIVGQGLSAVSPRSKGAYVALIKASIEKSVSLYDFGEFDTQLNNYETIKVYQRLGMDFVRSKYTFHKWLTKSYRKIRRCSNG